MNDVAEKLESILATASEMLIAEGMTSVAEILRTSTPRLEETGYDNWNGGTTIWTIYLLLEPSAYAQIQEKQRKMWEDVRDQICAEEILLHPIYRSI